MTTDSITVSADQLTLADLVWRKYRRPIPGLVEQVLALNPGLAQLGPYIPLGTVVVLPVLQEAAQPAEREIIQLWD
ncbi:tail protein X [Brevundimonas bacteroides]|uniref:tail protein X n=1 Tax=Brevundimonas bacteroides TaxID=74311 RepID=UPI0004969394|nr:tail protein X [Brevundimonas bacteroides]